MSGCLVCVRVSSLCLSNDKEKEGGYVEQRDNTENKHRVTERERERERECVCVCVV